MKARDLPGIIRIGIAIGVLIINIIFWLILPEKLYDKLAFSVDLINK